jgi:hypothetical protein
MCANFAFALNGNDGYNNCWSHGANCGSWIILLILIRFTKPPAQAFVVRSVLWLVRREGQDDAGGPFCTIDALGNPALVIDIFAERILLLYSLIDLFLSGTQFMVARRMYTRSRWRLASILYENHVEMRSSLSHAFL